LYRRRWYGRLDGVHDELRHGNERLSLGGRELGELSQVVSRCGATGLTDDYTAEIFSPPYLFNVGVPSVARIVRVT
jgi:hypothetical protein